ncbi:MAG: hemolysin III family protein [Dongiaceae bacterium]
MAASARVALSGAAPRTGQRSERAADAAVHAAGLSLGPLACLALLLAALDRADLRLGVALALYGAGLMAMLAFSAAYNLAPPGPLRPWLRRLDHAAIFTMIAGTYTPVMVVAVGGTLGAGLLAVVWAGALAGAAIKLLRPAGLERLSVPAYLALGWAVVPALGPIARALPALDLALLLGGGLLYSAGTVFHLWRRLPYHDAIWHGFVLAGAACHYAVIYRLAIP